MNVTKEMWAGCEGGVLCKLVLSMHIYNYFGSVKVAIISLKIN